MEHINDIELQEYVSGRLPEARVLQVRQHLAGCDVCESRYKDAVDLWHALGHWRVDPSGHEIADRIETLVAESESRRWAGRVKIIPFIRSFPAALRIAAAIIISIAGGHLLGRYSVSQKTKVLPVTQEKPRYIAALGFEWSSELTWMALEEEAALDEVN